MFFFSSRFLKVWFHDKGNGYVQKNFPFHYPQGYHIEPPATYRHANAFNVTSHSPSRPSGAVVVVMGCLDGDVDGVCACTGSVVGLEQGR